MRTKSSNNFLLIRLHPARRCLASSGSAAPHRRHMIGVSCLSELPVLDGRNPGVLEQTSSAIHLSSDHFCSSAPLSICMGQIGTNNPAACFVNSKFFNLASQVKNQAKWLRLFSGSLQFCIVVKKVVFSFKPQNHLEVLEIQN